MLDDFWEALNPDPESPVNEAYLEFQYRLAYVQKFLGGFGQYGANDERGEVFLLMGPADEVQLHHMPMNFRDQDDARIKVYRAICSGPGRNRRPRGPIVEGTQGLDPYQDVGGIPMPYSRRAEDQRHDPDLFSDPQFRLRIVEIRRCAVTPCSPTGSPARAWGSGFCSSTGPGPGDYSLESSNVMQGEE